MADNEDESNMTSTITVGDLADTVKQVQCVSELAAKSDTPVMPVDESANQSQTGEKIIAASATELTVAQGLTDFLQSCTAKQEGDCRVVTQIVDSDQVEQNMFMHAGTDYTTISADIVNALPPNTTIIYVQPDGTFVEGSGLTAEEQRALVEQLSKQQIVQVSETEAARLLEQNQVVKTIPAAATTTQFIPSATLAPNELQQVIDQVTKSQHQQQQASIVHVTQQASPAVTKSVEQQVLGSVDAAGLFTAASSHAEVTGSPKAQNNASQQLKNVAKQAAMQSTNSVRVVQKKVRSQCWVGDLMNILHQPHVSGSPGLSILPATLVAVSRSSP